MSGLWLSSSWFLKRSVRVTFAHPLAGLSIGRLEKIPAGRDSRKERLKSIKLEQ